MHTLGRCGVPQLLLLGPGCLFWETHSKNQIWEGSRWGANYCCLGLAVSFFFSLCSFSVLKTPGSASGGNSNYYELIRILMLMMMMLMMMMMMMILWFENLSWLNQDRPIEERRSSRRMTGVIISTIIIISTTAFIIIIFYHITSYDMIIWYDLSWFFTLIKINSRNLRLLYWCRIFFVKM